MADRVQHEAGFHCRWCDKPIFQNGDGIWYHRATVRTYCDLVADPTPCGITDELKMRIFLCDSELPINFRPELASEERISEFAKSTASLHADIIDQGRKVQIAASGESKYGAMSAGEYIEWVIGKLEGK